MTPTYLGDYLAGQTVRFSFNTIATTGAPVTLTSGAITITKDGTDLVSPGGVTFTTDSGGETGKHTVVIDSSIDTTSFASGRDYSVRLTGGSAVAGVSALGRQLFRFSIQNRSIVVDAAGNASANIKKIFDDTAAAQMLQRSLGTMYYGTVTGATTATTLIDSGLTQGDTDWWKGRVLLVQSGTKALQGAAIQGFDPATDKLTFDALTAALTIGDHYLIV